MLRDKPAMLQLKEGRDLLRVCREIIRGTTWEMAIFPEADSFEDRVAKKRIESALDRHWAEFVDGPGGNQSLSYEAVAGIIRSREQSTGVDA
jgi:hypothetical protein